MRERQCNSNGVRSNPAAPAKISPRVAGFFLQLGQRDENPRGSGFDYQRKADESTPAHEMRERQCNSNGVRSNPAAPAKISPRVAGFFLQLEQRDDDLFFMNKVLFFFNELSILFIIFRK